MNHRADIFPAFASVTPADVDIAPEDLRSAPPSVGSFQLAIARVVLMNNRIIIARDAGNGPQVVFSEEVDPTSYYKSEDIRTKDSYIRTLSGKQIAWKKDSACGCGSRLKSWNPYNSILTSTKDPTE